MVIFKSRIKFKRYYNKSIKNFIKFRLKSIYVNQWNNNRQLNYD